MKSRIFCVVALLLWMIGAGVAAWFFVKGRTTTATDGRTQILLTPVERDAVLAEMRQLLKAVHEVVTGDQDQNFKAAEGVPEGPGCRWRRTSIRPSW